MGELEYAFEYFAGGKQTISVQKIEEVFRDITPIDFSDAEVKEMIKRLNLPADQDMVDVHDFCEVVCRSNFPRKDRRKYSHSGASRRASMDSMAADLPSGRSFTKELGKRLQKVSSFTL